MRLIVAQTYQMVEYYDSQIPPYAILSHTWGEEEITYQDMQNGRPVFRRAKQGWSKIEQACKETLRQNLGYVWVDTCCIDKTNSVELSEAINSMFRWYKNSEVCLAYLSDLVCGSNAPEEKEIFASRWWGRGWTLQELIAPRHLQFYTSTWQFIGSKTSWANSITRHKGIPLKALHGRLNTASVAQKFSWAASRKTTRLEDEAYSLLGLFDVNMPLLYGEGTKAFRRLQEEIMRTGNDLTIFAHHPFDATADLLAGCTADFRETGDIRAAKDTSGAEFSLTNRGLRMTGKVPIYPGNSMDNQRSERAYFMLVGVTEGNDKCLLRLTKIGTQVFHRAHFMMLISPKKTDSNRAFVYVDKALFRSSECLVLTCGDHQTVDTYGESSLIGINLSTYTGQTLFSCESDFSVSLTDVTPHASFDVARDLFYQRYGSGQDRRSHPQSEVVIALKFWARRNEASCADECGARDVDPVFVFVVLCDTRTQSPRARLFGIHQHPRLLAFLFAAANREHSIPWSLLEMVYPEVQHLPNVITINCNGHTHKLSALFEIARTRELFLTGDATRSAELPSSPIASIRSQWDSA